MLSKQLPFLEMRFLRCRIEIQYSPPDHLSSILLTFIAVCCFHRAGAVILVFRDAISATIPPVM